MEDLDNVMQRRVNTNCEWFHRPDFALSELSGSVVSNWEYVKKNLGTIGSPKILSKLSDHMEAFVEPLTRVNSKNPALFDNVENDFKKVFNFMDQGNKNLSSRVVNSFMEDARKLGS